MVPSARKTIKGLQRLYPALTSIVVGATFLLQLVAVANAGLFDVLPHDKAPFEAPAAPVAAVGAVAPSPTPARPAEGIPTLQPPAWRLGISEGGQAPFSTEK